MSRASQKLALKNYRIRLNRRGLSRFEVLGLNTDRGLIRSLAKLLAENDEQASRIRVSVNRTICASPGKKGGVLAALRRSPLVGAQPRRRRCATIGRKVKL